MVKDVISDNLFLVDKFIILRSCYTFPLLGKVLSVGAVDISDIKIIGILIYYNIPECDYFKYKVIKYNDVVIGVGGLWFCEVFFCFKYRPALLFCLY
jgi:hypothetical protein